MRSYGVVKALEKETTTVKENAMCVLVHLLQNREEEKAMIGRGRVIMHLVKLLDGRELRGKKNVATVQYVLCSTTKENKVKAVSAGVIL